MKWIEVVRVRSSSAALEEAIPFLKKTLHEIRASSKAKETFMAQHALYSGDLSVVVVWNNEEEPVKTRDGMLLAQQLQCFGPVDHAVWIPLSRSSK